MEPDRDMCKEVKRARAEIGGGWVDGWMAKETWELLWSEHGPGDLSGTQGCTHGMGKARAGW